MLYTLNLFSVGYSNNQRTVINSLSAVKNDLSYCVFRIQEFSCSILSDISSVFTWDNVLIGLSSMYRNNPVCVDTLPPLVCVSSASCEHCHLNKCLVLVQPVND